MRYIQSNHIHNIASNIYKVISIYIIDKQRQYNQMSVDSTYSSEDNKHTRLSKWATEILEIRDK